MEINILSNLAHDLRIENEISNLEFNHMLLNHHSEVHAGGFVKPVFGTPVENARRIMEAKNFNGFYLNNERCL